MEAADAKKGTAKQQASDLNVRTSNYTFKDVGGCTKVLQVTTAFFEKVLVKNRERWSSGNV